MKKLLLLIMLISNIGYLTARDIQITIFDSDIDLPLEGVKIIDTITGNNIFTDQEGKALLTTSSDTQFIIITELIGYQKKKTIINAEDTFVRIGMSMEFVLEGTELIIEGKIPGKSDEKVGVSKVVEKNELKATAMSGPMPDVMSTVKTLPGVVYAGKFNPNFSVRGGEPNDMTMVMDGMIIRYPWHWGGGFSIFNPNTIDALKFSAGIFSAKYGPASSGLMEVNTITPDNGLKAQITLSSMTAEILLQIPFIAGKSGMFIGGRLTSQDLPILMVSPLLNEQGLSFTRSPYIYDGYFKWFLKPVDRVEWYVNGFVGSDGIGMVMIPPGLDKTKDIVTKSVFTWNNIGVIANTGLKVLFPGDKVFMHFLGGYEFHKNRVDSNFEMEGTKKYSRGFVDRFGGLLGISSGDSFQIDIRSNGGEGMIDHAAQTRLDFDFMLHEKVMLSIGAGTLYQFVDYEGGGKFYSVGFEDGAPVYKPFTYSINKESKSILTSFAYINGEFKILPGIFSIDAGVRADHIYLQGEGYDLNTYPVPGPRISMHLTPFKPNQAFESMKFSLGAGLFTKGPMELVVYEKEYGIEDFEMTTGKTFTVVTGMETMFPFNVKLTAEGYFKYHFDKYYINTPADSTGTAQFLFHDDGYGYAGGFDINLERKMSRYFDGSLTYSFVYMRMIYPETDGVALTLRGEPVGKWFYPSYHRYHSGNIVLNARPTDFFTITSKFSIASGVPQKEASTPVMFTARDESGNNLELYTIQYTYSDTLRTQIAIPFDLKVTFNFFIPKTKIYMEIYAGVEDLFSPLYSPQGATQVDMFSGKEIPGSDGSGMNMGVPMPSFGFTMSF